MIQPCDNCIMHKVNQYIKEALFALLEKKDLEDISISELIAKAGVCRASFYRNFMSLEHVVRDYVVELMDKIGDDMPITATNLYEHSIHSYAILQKEKKRLSIMQKRNLLFMLDEGYYLLCRKQIKRLNAYRDEYQIAFFAGSSAFIIRTWIKNNFRETPEELSKIMSGLLVKIAQRQ